MPIGKITASELENINKRIETLSSNANKKKPDHLGNVFVLSFALLCILGIVYLGNSITGFVTFSESTVKIEDANFSVTEPSTIAVKTNLANIDSILLSGSVHGKGKAAVFLIRPERKYLAYYFEGDATDGMNFSDMCYDTCHIEGLGNENLLEFQLQGTTIDIDDIKYMYGKLIDIELEPLITTIDYATTPATILELKLTNKLNADYTVVLYVDGPLSSSFSWQGSLVHMTKDTPEKVIPISVKLPSNLAKGTYTNKITARYVPPDTNDFVGESPVAESFVTVVNE